MKRTILIAALAVTLSACAPVDLPTGDALFTVRGIPFADEESASVSTGVSSFKAAELSPYTVLYEAPEIERAKYEPPFGCYLGVLLTSGSSLRAFDKNAPHAVYTGDIVLGESFPSDFMLSCIASRATPLVFIHPNPEKALSVTQINDAAVWLGNYNLPMFVAFCPVTPETKMSEENYRVYFRHARSLLKIQAPLAAMMWHTDSEVENADDFYPGHDVVDWVGFSGLEEDVLGSFEDFYLKYQKDKPVMFGPFGVSHFSERDYTYRNEEAGDKISDIYTKMRDFYPRVKMVSYADINLLPGGGGEDYSFSQSPDLREAYTSAIEDDYFLTALEGSVLSERSEWIRSADAGYVKDGKAEIAGHSAEEFGAVRADHARKILYVYADKLPDDAENIP